MNSYKKMIAIALITLASLSRCSIAADTGGSCIARAPPKQFTRAVPDGCTTCSCASSSNAKFYNPARPETCCGASEAKYNVKFVGTWTNTCHPYYDNSITNRIWSPLTGISHDYTYEVWNACMNNVSLGVALVSQTGGVDTIQAEYRARGDSVKDIILGGLISGDGMTMDEFSVNCSYPYVTVLSMLAPSMDRMIGVAGLKLCNGDTWKSYVKVCAELFSTATKSERVHSPRNSIQEQNCSFGYFTFNLTEDSNMQIPDTNPDPDSCTCQAKVPQQCPSDPIVSLRRVRDCCCKSTKNIKFYLPKGPNPVCTADGEPEYRVRFKSTWTRRSHRDYYLSSAHWSPLTGVSHDPSYEVWNACMFNVSRGVALVSQLGAVSTIEAEYDAQGDLVKDKIRGTVIQQDGETNVEFTVNSTHNYVSVLSMLAPSVDRMVGVSRLDLCNGNKWRRYVKICSELFSTATKSDRVATPNSIQMNNCSFGYFVFRNLEPCYNTGFDIADFDGSFCSATDFIMLVKIIRGSRIYGRHPAHEEFFNLTVTVQTVYRMKGQKAPRPRSNINVLVCDLPDTVLTSNYRPRRNSRLLIMGHLYAESLLVVDSNGYLEVRGRQSKMKARACKNSI